MEAFVRLFVGLSFAALVIYALLPAAPPWAAARCTAGDVAGGPPGPRCMFRPARGVPDGGLLGAMQTNQDGANGWVERIVTRGWGKLHLHTASALIDQGQANVNLVAAIPSLHAGMTAAIAAFLWTACTASGGRCWSPTCSSWRSRWCTRPSTTSSTSCSDGLSPQWSWRHHATRGDASSAAGDVNLQVVGDGLPGLGSRVACADRNVASVGQFEWLNRDTSSCRRPRHRRCITTLVRLS